MDVIAEESKKVKDVSTSNRFSGFSSIFDKIASMISVGIFKSPPFSLENIFPGVDLFKNKYFKLASMLIIYLGLMVFVLKAFKPKTTEEMIIVYSVSFWIALMAFSIAVINPYDENSVEYMLKDKVIKRIQEMVESTDDTEDIKPSAPEIPSSEQSQDSSKDSSEISTKNMILLVFLMVFFGGLKIYSFLYPFGV